MRYCAYHQMIFHPFKSCYIFKDQIQTLVDAQVLKLRLEQKTVTANMTTCQHIGQTPPIVMEVEPVSKAELWIINSYPGNQKEKGWVSLSTLDWGRIWVHPHLLYADKWSASSSSKMKSKNKDKSNKTKSASCNVASASFREVDFDIILHPDSKDVEEEILYTAQTEIPFAAATLSGNHTLNSMMSWSLVHPSHHLQKQPSN